MKTLFAAPVVHTPPATPATRTAPFAITLTTRNAARTAARLAAWATAFVAVCALAACSKPAPQEPVVRAVKTVVVSAASASTVQQFSGEVRARVESRLGFRVAGKITKRHVEAGQTVRSGQALMEVDAADYVLAQTAASAGVTAARVDYEQQVADLKRFTDLFNQGFISGTELDRRKAGVNAAKARLDQSQAVNAGQSNQARYSTLFADADGVVVSIEAEPGQVVAAGTPVLRLARSGARDVVFALPEDLAASVTSGQALGVRLWSAPDTRFQATVREVAAAADAATRTYLVKATLPQADGLKLGMTASVELGVASAAPALIKLPLSAVFEQQGQSSVWVFDPASGTVAARAIKVASADGNAVVVASGLQAGQVVVAAGTHVLQAGMKVKALEQVDIKSIAPKQSDTLSTSNITATNPAASAAK
jgi:membrane fusion protein, multidrug efflux system